MTAALLGVCGWVLDRDDPARSIELAAGVGASCVQLGFFSEDSISTAKASRLKRRSVENNIALVGSFVAFRGEDYASFETIAETGGLAPDDPYPARRAAIERVARISKELGCSSVAMHIGTIPADQRDPMYARLLLRAREIAGLLGARGVRFLIETGRESGDTLAVFLEELNCANVRVSFDVGNFVVYGTDDPSRAVRPLRDYIDIVHIKDATRSLRGGLEYGSPTPLGVGDVQVARVVNKLRIGGFVGPMLVEAKGADAVREGLSYLNSLLR